MATIDTSNETYFIEPLWRVIDNPQHYSHDVILYRASDVKWNGTTILEKYISGDHNEDINDYHFENSSYHRRDVTDNCDTYNNINNTCVLHLVVDYDFYLNVGNGDVKTSVYYVLMVIRRIDGMFKATCWDGVGKGIGIQVKKITVHTVRNTSVSYSNVSKDSGGYGNLLDQLSYGNWDDVCLAHLFTYREFNSGVVGLAYVAYQNSSYGGICSSPKTKADDNQWRIYNCGFSTYRNNGRTLSLAEASLVTAHEIGHGFGAHHDNSEIKRCTPAGSSGNYVMYPESLKGDKENNALFSYCSKAQVGRVIMNRNNCLKQRDVKSIDN